jgi:hypothetical protein
MAPGTAGPHAGHKPRTLPATSGHPRALITGRPAGTLLLVGRSPHHRPSKLRLRQAESVQYQLGGQAGTHIGETIIRGIEEDDFAACGGDFYARGHIRAIARAAGVDGEPLAASTTPATARHRPAPLPPCPRPTRPIPAPEPSEGNFPQALALQRSPPSEDNSWGARPIIRSARHRQLLWRSRLPTISAGRRAFFLPSP